MQEQCEDINYYVKIKEYILKYPLTIRVQILLIYIT